MNIKDQIRAEIERRKGYISVTHFAEELLAFLDSLPEQPDGEEKFRNLLDAMGDCGFSQNDILLLKSIWEDADCQIPQRAQPRAGLGEAAEEYRRESCNAALKPNVDGPTPEYVGSIKAAFIAGAKWQKDKMMEGAVEGKVFMSFASGHNQMVMADVDLPTNTKVKVIIVKEDEK